MRANNFTSYDHVQNVNYQNVDQFFSQFTVLRICSILHGFLCQTIFYCVALS